MASSQTIQKNNRGNIDRIFQLGENLLVGLFNMIVDSGREAYLGYMNGHMPIVRLLQVSCAASFFFCFKVDLHFVRLFKNVFPMFQILIPTGIFRVILWTLFAVLPFFMWGWKRHKILQAVIEFLKDAFISAGLVSNDRTPRLIRDYVTDTDSRVLQFLSDGITESQFIEKQEILENKLSVRIEKIKANKEFPKLIDIEFANGELTNNFELTDIHGYKDFTFPIGTTRSQVIIGDLKKTPHYLFAGQTGSGKSTFIRTMATVLLANNEDLICYFIDLKGTEAASFEGLPRLKVTIEEKGALNYILSVKNEIESRKEKFHKARVRDLESYNNKFGSDNRSRLPRILLIIDEFANLMPHSGADDYATIKKASTTINWIARIGRSFGVNLVVGIQKPDTKNMDSTTKANLEGILCFQVKTRSQSQVVLDTNKAADLGGIRGRAIWQTSSDEAVVQAPIIRERIINDFIREVRNEQAKFDSRTADGVVGESTSSEGDSPNSEDSAWSKFNS